MSKSSEVQLMAWHKIYNKHKSETMLIQITDIHVFNSSPPGQNGRHFADEKIERIFLNENVWI